MRYAAERLLTRLHWQLARIEWGMVPMILCEGKDLSNCSRVAFLIVREYRVDTMSKGWEVSSLPWVDCWEVGHHVPAQIGRHELHVAQHASILL